ncbi:MAG: hypothetical protein HYV65_02475 [Candidatus Spechtbacteria bacterium]|nr:hypothetical protein [Candidatus Spechtbacteria bacterium]
MSHRLIIASDLDGTIADHTRTKIDLARQLGHSLTEGEAVSDIMKLKIPENDYTKIGAMVYGEDSLRASVMPSAKETIEKLAAAFGPIYIISRRGNGVEAEYGMKWIEQNIIPPLSKENIFFVRDDAEKQLVAQRLGVSVYIDDRQNVLDQMPNVARRILFDPHDNFPHSKYPRIHSWEELPFYISTIKSL